MPRNTSSYGAIICKMNGFNSAQTDLAALTWVNDKKAGSPMVK
jgi:hypothetical protein